MSESLKLGEIITTEQQRDAVHIAVCPVTADDHLWPGIPIAFSPGSKELVGKHEPAIGIVDPFLKTAVHKGQRFWMYLIPGTITSLRHEWTHPAICGPIPCDDKAESEAWLRDFAKHNDCPSYETLLEAVADGNPDTWDEEYLHFNGSDAHGEIPDEFWHHVEIVIGRKVKHAKYFSCSC